MSVPSVQPKKEDKVVNIKKAVKCKEAWVQLAPYLYGRWEVVLPERVEFQTILDPEFWSQVAYKFAAPKFSKDKSQEGSIIEVRTDDHWFYAELYVRAVRDSSLVVTVLKEPVYFFERKENGASAKYITRFNSGTKKFDILRTTDRQIVGDGYRLKEEAEAEIAKLT